jgi:methylated-DNA-[protein]-cysteine S-methyltransferase
MKSAEFRLEGAKMYSGRCETPVGPMLAVVDANGALVRLEFEKGRRPAPAGVRLDPARCRAVLGQLSEYFEGRRREFDLALSPEGTPFQKAVWEELCRIPYGERVSYSEIARRIGRPEAVRAVGAANGANPIAVVIPCHRVVGSDGSLTGYGSGLPVKSWLLDHETGMRRLPFPAPPAPAKVGGTTSRSRRRRARV